MAAGDWRGLEALTSGADWKEFEFLRLALLARAQRENGKMEVFPETWQAAVTAASGDRYTLDELWQLVSTWGPAWENQLNSILWAIGDKWEDRKALQLLYAKYARASDTTRLREVTEKMVVSDPTNRNAINNLAMFSLLLKIDLADAVKKAGELYASDNGNPTFASTYAYALYLEGYPAQALKIMESLDPKQLDDPSIATYYGILLAANKQPAKAVEFLRIALKNPKLLPEEKKLVESAMNESNLKIGNPKPAGGTN